MPAQKKARRPAARKTHPALARHKPETLRLRAASPGFTVNDIEKSLAWYRDVIGFTVKDRWEQDGKLMGLEIVAGSVLFMISQDDWKKGRYRKKGEGFRIYCKTAQNVDELAAGIKGRGGELIQEPTDQPWGMRDFAVVDPDGFKITISSL